MIEKRLTLGVDIGGTNVKIGVVNESGLLCAASQIPFTPQASPEELLEDIARRAEALLRKISPHAQCNAAGIGVPGPLDISAGRVIRCANLPRWVDVPVKDLFARRMKCPVVLDNDANAAALGEFCFGAGRNADPLVMFTLGTGVGAGIILQGRIFRGRFGNAGELGHTIVAPDGIPCPCGQRGCLEQYASASAVSRRFRELTRNRRNLSPEKPKSRLAGLTDPRESKGAEGISKSPLRSTNETLDPLADSEGREQPRSAAEVLQLAESGDAIARGVWSDACRFLAVACVNLQHTLNPQRIVLGGGLANAGAALLEPVRCLVREKTWNLHNDMPEIVLSQLADDAGVIGAAAMASRLDP